jgi:acylphosphatase
VETKRTKKSKTQNYKFQINSKSKKSNSKRFEFWSFAFWYCLEFGSPRFAGEAGALNLGFMKMVHIFISGFVQGVGFRQFIKINADKLGLKGWARNLPDGRVEAVFEGLKEKIEQMISLCKKGPFLSEVENVETRWEEAKEQFAGFEIMV